MRMEPMKDEKTGLSNTHGGIIRGFKMNQKIFLLTIILLWGDVSGLKAANPAVTDPGGDPDAHESNGRNPRDGDPNIMG